MMRVIKAWENLCRLARLRGGPQLYAIWILLLIKPIKPRSPGDVLPQNRKGRLRTYCRGVFKALEGG
eukprot:1374211-Amorphochlora_amoeboformis.AAC.2